MLEEINQIRDGKKEKYEKESQQLRVKIHFSVSVHSPINILK